MRPDRSPTRLLMLMWSSAIAVPDSTVSSVQLLSAAPSTWYAKRIALDAWSDHSTPILPSKAITAEMSSAATSVSAPAMRNGSTQVVWLTSEWVTETTLPRAKGTQSRPSLSLSMVADSLPAPPNWFVRSLL